MKWFYFCIFFNYEKFEKTKNQIKASLLCFVLEKDFYLSFSVLDIKFVLANYIICENIFLPWERTNISKNSGRRSNPT